MTSKLQIGDLVEVRVLVGRFLNIHIGLVVGEVTTYHPVFTFGDRSIKIRCFDGIERIEFCRHCHKIS